MHDESKPTAARVTSASTILKFSRESLELDDLAARLAALEQRVAEPAKKQYEYAEAA